ncbi:hypothetical protein IRT45_12910 [Nocardia sp. BSTN01]|uniref:hypothetical protein n=1 Tax=Nocardia sp. BSTN01 TaxID=2783665 RepID=UPI0018903F43|nr:hypothetical protein [Nocardia sp. BSTN01]MBF4998051.1 hypothetical protein [Nocardia sp. BSTN01]
MIGPIPHWLNRILGVELTVFEFTLLVFLGGAAIGMVRVAWVTCARVVPSVRNIGKGLMETELRRPAQ